MIFLRVCEDRAVCEEIKGINYIAVVKKVSNCTPNLQAQLNFSCVELELTLFSCVTTTGTKRTTPTQRLAKGMDLYI